MDGEPAHVSRFLSWLKSSDLEEYESGLIELGLQNVDLLSAATDTEINEIISHLQISVINKKLKFRHAMNTLRAKNTNNNNNNANNNNKNNKPKPAALILLLTAAEHQVLLEMNDAVKYANQSKAILQETAKHMTQITGKNVKQIETVFKVLMHRLMSRKSQLLQQNALNLKDQEFVVSSQLLRMTDIAAQMNALNEECNVLLVSSSTLGSNRKTGTSSYKSSVKSRRQQKLLYLQSKMRRLQQQLPLISCDTRLHLREEKRDLLRIIDEFGCVSRFALNLLSVTNRGSNFLICLKWNLKCLNPKIDFETLFSSSSSTTSSLAAADSSKNDERKENANANADAGNEEKNNNALRTKTQAKNKNMIVVQCMRVVSKAEEIQSMVDREQNDREDDRDQDRDQSPNNEFGNVWRAQKVYYLNDSTALVDDDDDDTKQDRNHNTNDDGRSRGNTHNVLLQSVFLSPIPGRNTMESLFTVNGNGRYKMRLQLIYFDPDTNNKNVISSDTKTIDVRYLPLGDRISCAVYGYCRALLDLLVHVDDDDEDDHGDDNNHNNNRNRTETETRANTLYFDQYSELFDIDPMASLINVYIGDSMSHKFLGVSDASYQSIRGWFMGNSFDASAHTWNDISGQNNHIVGGAIRGNVRVRTDTAAAKNNHDGNDAGSRGRGGGGVGAHCHPYVFGGTRDNIALQRALYLRLPYTLVHVSRYNGAARKRIFQAANYNWLSGHWNGASGIVFHSGWMTNQTDVHQSNWVLSVDQPTLYRSNGVQRSTNNGNTSAETRVCINTGQHAELSDWAVAEFMIFDCLLSRREILNVELYLTEKYHIR